MGQPILVMTVIVKIAIRPKFFAVSISLAVDHVPQEFDGHVFVVLRADCGGFAGQRLVTGLTPGGVAEGGVAGGLAG